MSVSSALAAGRRAAEARMSSRCVVKRAGGATVQDEATGAEVPAWATVYADAPFRLGGSNQGSTGSRVVEVDGGELALATRVAHFPVSHDALADGDLIEITAGENAGLVLRVVEATWQDQATARRVQVVEDRRPEEWA